jgi:excisionase family DNA binding protein
MVSVLQTGQPDADDAALAREALVRARRFLADHPADDRPVEVRVTGERETLTVPRPAVDLLVRVLANMAAGHGVTVVPSHAELTTQQAAEVLNVSRPFVIKLLEEGLIDYRTVGTHRRIRADSLLEYKRRDDTARHDAAGELAAMTQELGLT